MIPETLVFLVAFVLLALVAPVVVRRFRAGRRAESITLADPPARHRLGSPDRARPVDTLIEGPPAVAGDTVKDWLQHYTYGRRSWADAVAEFYRRAARDPEIADYFRGVDLERLQRHFTAAMIMITGRGLRASTVERIRAAHEPIRNSAGRPITGDVYDRVIGVLVSILVEWDVPRSAIVDLARVIGPFRAAVVVDAAPQRPR